MAKYKTNFQGLLANVNSSILKVNLEHGFKFESMSLNEFVEFWSKLFNTSPMNAFRQIPQYNDIISEGKNVFFVSNSINEELEVENFSKPIFSSLDFIKFESKLVPEYLERTLRLMRLYKEGNIFMPFHHYYYLKDNKPHSAMSTYTMLNFTREPFTITDEEIPKINHFINSTKIPFEEPFLQLAFENFELTYRITEPKLSFLTLMISLETLFHPSESGELNYRISRNVATLLGGKIDKTSKKIFNEVKDLYNKRSALIHTGKNIIKNTDLPVLRYFVRESIKEIYRMELDKEEMLDLLNSRGFSS